MVEKSFAAVEMVQHHKITMISVVAWVHLVLVLGIVVVDCLLVLKHSLIE